MPDKYSATWVSHSSLTDFLHCPRAYYLNNVYKDPKTRHKIQLMMPPLALGSAVHEVLESLSVVPTDKRFAEPLLKRFEAAWKKISGKRGGFANAEQEARYKERGEAMLQRVQKNPGPLKNLAVKINQDLPHFWLSEEDNIILCGKIDWLEYFPDTQSVNIIDFKTSRSEESESSLQLPIYHLLVDACQKHKVDGAGYWYLGLNDQITPKELPDLEEAREEILKLAKQVKLARQLERFKCPEGDNGCRYCRPLERVLKGEAEKVGESDMRQDIYVLWEREKEDGNGEDSRIL